MKTLLLPFLLLFACSAGISAQTSYKITGFAVDKSTGAPIRGVNVGVEGTFYGTVSDVEGKFIISTSTPPPYTLVFERSPYAPVKLNVKEKFDNLKIELVSRVNNAAGATETASAEEYALKLVLIEKLLSEITWEQTGTDAFTIGVLGYNPFGDNIFALEGKKLKDQPVRVVFVHTAEELQTIDLLFVATTKANKKLYSSLIPSLQNLPVLTVADEKGKLEEEAMLSFFKAGESLAISLNEKAAKTAGIAFSARLRAMAQ